MAGMISRLKKISLSRIEAFLCSAENPEVLMPQLLRELEESIRKAAAAEARAASALRAEQRRCDELQGRLVRLERGAELALTHKDERLAREALAEQVKAERKLVRYNRALESSEKAYTEASSVRAGLEYQLDVLKSKKDELLARSRTAVAAKKAEYSGTDILAAVSRMESAVDAEEFTVETGRPGNPMLDQRLRQLERNQEIERRLDDMRKGSGD
jgi:phage shock protein A